MERLLQVLSEQAKRYAMLEEQVAIEALRRSGRPLNADLIFARVEISGQGAEQELLADLRSLPPELARLARLSAASGSPMSVSLEFCALLRQSARASRPEERACAPLARFRPLPSLKGSGLPAAPSAPAHSSSST